MKVVSNTSPICYLLLIDQIQLLQTLFSTITIPQAVKVELTHKNAPSNVKNWIDDLPEWLQIQSLGTAPNSPTLNRLHPGEREAIILAETLSADLLILDEKPARHAAQIQGLPVTGLLGILDQAATENLIDLSEAIERLYQTNFRASPRILKLLLDRHFG